MELRSSKTLPATTVVDHNEKRRLREVRFLSSLITDLSDLLYKSANNQHTEESAFAVEALLKEFPTVLLKVDVRREDGLNDSESEDESDDESKGGNGLWESVDVEAFNKKIEDLQKKFEERLSVVEATLTNFWRGCRVDKSDIETRLLSLEASVEQKN